ncbi:DUF3300 domain-containing protein [Paraglaciecola sp. 20A4]|uniref:DUF3300 domain-containing protein n=1 Tax=Paraglaciecola sp. 20A4 TaxID=2687288 RepID=UPI0014088952|nr:DUF3300 domain-containing protein [Paraglaciecola sp. 20A4]
MAKTAKYIIIYIAMISLFTAITAQFANAETQEKPTIELHQAKLDQMLAPIALYPDSLLSHILIAATYPLEVVQAARWRQEHRNLSEQQALDLAEEQDWDPSVIALTPFTELLERMSKDLDWLQNLGDAFLTNEAQVLDSVQTLRSRAYVKGNLQDNQYQNIEQEKDKIVIHSVERETVYVPYYDTRVVYGDWWWTVNQPIYWRSPRHYAYQSGFYWSPRFHISSGFFFGGFRWSNSYVVINHDYRYRRSNHRYNYSKVREYPRWQHNSHHRRSVKYRSGHTNNHQRTITSRNYESQQNLNHRKQVISRLKNQQSDNSAPGYKSKTYGNNKHDVYTKHKTSSHSKTITAGKEQKRDNRIHKAQRSEQKIRKNERAEIKTEKVRRATSDSVRNKQVQSNRKVERMSSSKQQQRSQSSARRNTNSHSTSHSNRSKSKRVEP